MHPDFEIIYVFTNPSYKEGLIKIGRTDKSDPRERAKELFTTGVPTEFEVYYAAKVEKNKNVESKVHELLSEYRYNGQREFFLFSKEKAKLAISISGAEEINFQTFENDNEIKSDEKFDIYKANVPIGSKLVFLKNHKFVCSVHSNNLVNFRGKLLSLSKAAIDTGLINKKDVYGPCFWMYENETLHNRMKKYTNL